MLNICSPVDMRKSLEMTQKLKNIGMLFVPIPVFNQDDYESLLALFSKRLDKIIELTEEEK